MKKAIEHKSLALAIMILLTGMMACNQKQKIMEKGSYAYDMDFLEKHNVEFLELTNRDSLARIIVVPEWQGRVMTSTANGRKGKSFGWINYDFIKKGEVSSQFNVFGGEERFWIGPEGGKFSIYFDEGREQAFSNWKVPPCLNTEAYDISQKGNGSVSMTKSVKLTNASGTDFILRIDRKLSLLSMEDIAKDLDVNLPQGLKIVAYRSDNSMTNTGDLIWTKERGLLSVWMLCMFTPSPSTTVFMPYNEEYLPKDVPVVNDEYFGKVPSERLHYDNGYIFFKIDGKYRSKIGVPKGRARNICGSYDADNNVLTILWFNLPDEDLPYVNSKWGEQDDPYNGDVVNSYNDGPLEDGSIMGPFYEIETSSPGALLDPGESILHTQKVYHIEAEENMLDKISRKVFGLSISEIKTEFTN